VPFGAEQKNGNQAGRYGAALQWMDLLVTCGMIYT